MTDKKGFPHLSLYPLLPHSIDIHLVTDVMIDNVVIKMPKSSSKSKPTSRKNERRDKPIDKIYVCANRFYMQIDEAKAAVSVYLNTGLEFGMTTD